MELLVRFLATYFIFILVILAVFLFRKRVYSFWLLALASYGLAKLIEVFLKTLIFVPRPYVTLGKIPLTLLPPTDSSFPSGHSSSAFLLATLVFLYNKKLGIVFYIGALLIGIGRVLVLVHYPVDIIGGAILGVFSSLLIYTLAKRSNCSLDPSASSLRQAQGKQDQSRNN